MPVFGTSKPVSRVLSFKTAIYLDAPLPVRSSRLPGTVGPTMCPSTALLRIEFTAMGCSQPSGELLPRLSTLTVPVRPGQRYISVALFLGSPPAGVTRYPCPAEPGLSSQTGLSPRPRGCPACLPDYDSGKGAGCQMVFSSPGPGKPGLSPVRTPRRDRKGRGAVISTLPIRGKVCYNYAVLL